MKSKISFFLPSFNIGGVERVFINYANALSDKGYNVDFVVCKAELKPGIAGKKLISHKMPKHSINNTFKYLTPR